MNIDKHEIDRLYRGFNDLTAMVVGDVMIDAYYWGRVDRISPEAPVPIVQITERENRLGGAANVALNVMSLGAKPIICSVIGNDEKADLFEALLAKRDFSSEGIERSTERPTTVKTRIISSDQHLLRVDEESTRALSQAEETAFIQRCTKVIESGEVDVLIFEDYNKGLLTEHVISSLISLARKHNIPVTVDPKKENFFAYQHATLFKPNFKELVEGVKLDIDKNSDEAIVAGIREMESKLSNELSLVTLSERGVMVKQGDQVQRIPAHPRKIIDVSGAGDTVISVASLILALKGDPAVIAGMSNLAGGLVCEKVGVVPIDKELLFDEVRKNNS
ncbi:MAG: bifunctional ADP-heptose synthase [Flavobacteriales bacterium]|nr:bifunctional ADP-heptose synthase [Flavobacteriales bacterium]